MDTLKAARTISGRGTFLLAGVLFLFLALGGRLVQLQYVQHEELARSASGFVESQVNWSARRGMVMDARKRPLAVSLQVKSCAIDPKLAKDSPLGLDGVLAVLQERLSLTPAELDRVYRVAGRENSRFAWVRRKLGEQENAALEGVKLPGVFYPLEHERRYPQGTLGAHVMGFADIDGKGREGVEDICDSVLRGLDGSRRVWRDALGKKLADNDLPLEGQSPALDVVLSLDSYVQALAEQEVEKAVTEFRAKSGSAIVMDPITGDILAMAGFPTFDPASPAAGAVENRLNPVIAATYEPGSIFKPFVVAGAIDCGAVTAQTVFHCENGAWRMPNSRRVLRDVHGYGNLTVEMIVAKSSNIAMAKIAAVMGQDRTYEYVRAFGFGERTEVPLRGELAAVVRPLHKWDGYSMGSVPMGQEVTVTSLQVAAAYSALCNGGVLLRPRLVKNLLDQDGNVVSNVPVTPRRQVVKPRVAREVLLMLEKTVEIGTGKQADLADYRVGGKTGTAQLGVNAQEYAAGHRGYSPTRYVSSFVGVAPIENPRLVVVVSVREPKNAHYGGTVAAPAVRNILKGTLQYLQVPPSAPRTASAGSGGGQG